MVNDVHALIMNNSLFSDARVITKYRQKTHPIAHQIVTSCEKINNELFIIDNCICP
jgi:hypothetical protein